MKITSEIFKDFSDNDVLMVSLSILNQDVVVCFELDRRRLIVCHNDACIYVSELSK